MAQNRENPITKRSKKSIVSAMMGLLHEKSFEKITIKEIMEKADMARRTFYGNFNSKDEIIQYYFHDLFNSLRDRVQQEEALAPGKIAQTLFELALEDKENMLVAKKQGLMNMALVEKYSGDIASLFNRGLGTASNQIALNYAAVFYMGGVWRVLDQWLGEGAKDSPKKMAEMFQSMMGTPLFNVTEKRGSLNE